MRLSNLALTLAIVATLSACSSTVFVPPAAPAWSVNAVATLKPGGGYTVRTVTLSPEDCFVASDVAAARSALPQTIELRITLTRNGGRCRLHATDVGHTFEGAAANDTDSQVEIVLFADGEEKGRSIVPLVPPRQLDRI